ncbi:hypothetical protein [Nonomuraea lactucae]|uniref:hypothetical protein n=1 Tax=Nonomuraea lactucae TaxID=2249762 RepID=UPI0013B3BC88|nr:hypothetical protein [Nonomuraea lactucae]
MTVSVTAEPADVIVLKMTKATLPDLLGEASRPLLRVEDDAARSGDELITRREPRHRLLTGAG